MYDERSAGYRWVVRLLKLGIFALAATIVGWYAMQFRAARPAATKSPAQQVAIVRDGAAKAIARQIAAEAIDVADPSVVCELTAELSAGDAVGRELAAQTLGRLGAEGASAIDSLIAALADPEMKVRQQAAIALGRLGARPAEAAEALAHSVRDADLEIRGAIFEALRLLGDAGVIKLSGLLADADADIRRRAVIELGQMDRAKIEYLDAICTRLRDSDPRVRAEAQAALWRHSATHMDELVAALRDADPLVQSTACTLLGRMGPEAQPAIPELAKVVAANGACAGNARQTILKIGKDDALIRSQLAPLLENEGPHLPVEAAMFFIWFDRTNKALRERLLADVDDPRESVADNVIKLLHRTAPEGRLQRPELIEALQAAGGDVLSLVFHDDKVLRDRMYGMSFYYSTRFPFVGSGITDEDLKRLAGLNNVRLLDLSGNPVGDAGLEQIAKLEKLEWLLLYETKITSAGLAHLSKLPRLRTLALGGCKVTDEGLEHLESLPALEALDLQHTQVTDAGMKRLAGCKRLKALWLDETQITEAGLALLAVLPSLEDLGYTAKKRSLRGLAKLKGLVELQPAPESVVDDDLSLLADMPKLRKLTLSGTGVTDAGLEHLARLPQLELLALDQTAITDAGMTHVAKLTQLKHLHLRKTAITDVGLAKLASLENLKILDITETRTTERGRESLQQALLNLEWPLVPIKTPLTTKTSNYEVVGLKTEDEPDIAPFLP